MTTHFTAEQEQMLRQPLDASLIKHRPGAGGKLLKYIKGDNAIDTANRIFGFGGWGYRVTSRGHEVVTDGKQGPVDIYTADVELHVDGAAYPFPGDGVGIVTAPFTVEMHEKARKEATTDALKRALRHFGDQFGLCLYSEDDYVDAGDGTLVQVKEVTPQKNVQPKRVVDAEHARQLPPPQKNAQATKDALTPSFNQLVEAGILDESEQGWLKFCKLIISWLQLANIKSSQQLLETLTESQVEMVKSHVVAERQKAA